jgi:adenosyl cobinamide kinase/adenosyl cobinamide phosphate guanylyltransferase
MVLHAFTGHYGSLPTVCNLSRQRQIRVPTNAGKAHLITGTNMNATLTQIPSPVLVLGPAHCGKSEWAHQLLSPTLETVVLGTAPETEPSFARRIAALQDLRPAAWESRSVGDDLTFSLGEAALGATPYPQILIDSVSQWIALLTLGTTPGHEDEVENRVWERVQEFFRTISSIQTARIVVVSAEVGGSPAPSRPLERVYRHVVGLTNQKLAALSASVVSLQAGLPRFLKG